jgi:hypothetical protein
MNEKEPILGYVIAFVLVAILGFCVYWFLLKEKNPVENTTGNQNTNQNQDLDTDTPKDTNTDTETNTDGNTNPDTQVDNDTDSETDTPSLTDFSDYKNSSQSVGSKNSNKYRLKSVTDTSEDGYHSFVFVTQGATSEVMDIPYVVVSYNSSQSAIRVDFAGMTKDTTGIGYQKSRAINKEGVVKLYHNISSDSTEELYDIGISKETVFKVTSKDLADNSWEIKVDVKYPGASTTSDEDFGSDTFSKDLQSLDGALSADNAKVLSYSFSNAGGILTITYTVSGSSNRPVPSATAQMQSSDLELVFTDVVTDAAYKSLDGKKLGGLNIETSRSGNKSTYLFKNVSKEFKLYGSKSPNQVVLEIKL